MTCSIDLFHRVRTCADDRPTRRHTRPLTVALLFGLGACGGPDRPNLPDQEQVGAALLKPGVEEVVDGGTYIVDEHEGGVGKRVFVEALHWGRLVDVFDFDPDTGERRRMFHNLLISPSVADSPGVWSLETEPLSQVEELTILARNTVASNDAFDFAIRDAQINLAPVTPLGLDAGQFDIASLVARNAALEVRFSDLIDPATVALNDTVRLLVGSPPEAPFEPRLLLSTVHGGVPEDGQEFHSTRLIIDFTVSPAEQGEAGLPIQVNGSGLPPSSIPIDSTALPANVALRLPTRTVPALGQFQLLRNLDGKPLSDLNNGPVDAAGLTYDVVRAFRSGNSSDLFNGFLPDMGRPQIVGSQGLRVTGAFDDPEGQAGRDFVVDYEYSVTQCALAPQVGDVLRLDSGVDLKVRQEAAPFGAVVNGLRVELSGTSSVSAADLPGPGTYRCPWRVDYGPAGLAPCFVRFIPVPGDGADNFIHPDATITVEFSEPMDPKSGRAFDSFEVTTTADPLVPNDWIVGDILSSSSLAELTYRPVIELPNGPSSPEQFFVQLSSEAAGGGLRDLAGNPLDAALPQFQFALDPNALPNRSQNFVLRFADKDEGTVGAGGAGVDFIGQFTVDTVAEEIRPRPVARFSSVVDDVSSPLVAAMGAVPTGLQTPLSNLGSKLHTIWRYADLGQQISDFGFLDLNIDVEGLAFSPQSGQVVPASYPEFSMQLGHSSRLPDEMLNPSNVPLFPSSGFLTSASFEDNFQPVSDGPNATPVHDRNEGFTVTNLEVFLTGSQTPMLSLPMNRGKPLSQFRYFTFRDTGITDRGGFSQNSSSQSDPPYGVPFHQEVSVLSLPAPPNVLGAEDPLISIPGMPPTPSLDFNLDGISDVGWAYGNQRGLGRPAGLPTAALPLLMEFRCYPSETLSLNNLRSAIASGGFVMPSFRAFSTGGYDQAGISVIKDPDQQPMPTGGLNAVQGQGPLGSMTPPRDPVIYYGQADFVVRVSRVYSQVFEPAKTTVNDKHDFVTAVIEPSAEDQPSGTSVSLAYRGTTVRPLPGDAFIDGNALDVYGDVRESGPPSPQMAPSKQPWSASLDELDGSAGFQVRITFLSDPISGLTPSLSSLGFATRLF